MAGMKMTPAQLAALTAAGKYFGDPKLGKQRIKDFGKIVAGNAGAMSGAPIGDRRVSPKSVRANADKFGPQLPAKSSSVKPTATKPTTIKPTATKPTTTTTSTTTTSVPKKPKSMIGNQYKGKK